MKKLLIFFLLSTFYFLLATPIRAEANPGQACPPGESRYRPGGICERTTPAIPKTLNLYPLTCQDIPLAKLSGSGRSAPPATFTRTITSDISQAELGGLGPSYQAISAYSPDALAEIYPFNGLFDKPVSMTNQPRESARTYWRLMSAYEQANAKAAYFELVKNSDYVNNTAIQFSNPAKPQAGPTPTGGATTIPTNPKLGTNIGYGHTDPKFGTDSAGRPVTFLVDLNTDEAGLRNYRDLYAGASLRIVRIKNFSATTPVSDFSAAGSRFASVFGNDYVVLGNELNSIDTEYFCSTDLANCGSAYANQFAAFKSTFTGPNLSAAPLNVGNPTYDPVKFLDGARPAYDASTFLANNSYQSPSCSYDAIRCSKDSYKWFSQFLGSSAPVVLTEYGLAPPNDDRDLTKVAAFYQTLPTDVLAITPLIRNVCIQAKGEWLHLNGQNQFVDLDGKTIDPATCGSSESLEANDSISVLDLARALPACLNSYPVCKDFAKTYLNLSATNRSAYDALLPFNFDNVRGYQVLNQVVYKENLPYVRAIADGLNNAKSGLLNLLSPQWITNLRSGNLNSDPANPILGDTSGKTSSAELALKQAIIDYAAPYAPSNCLIHDNGTYLPSPLTLPSNLDGSNVKFNQDVDITISSVDRTTEYDSILDANITKYNWSGQARGNPVIVVNNPKLEDLSQSIKGPQSLTAMFLPGAGEAPNRDLVAPVAVLGASDSDTKVEGETFEEGKARIARTSGESQTQLCELRNFHFIPAGLQKSYMNCVDPYQTLIKAGAVAPPYTGPSGSKTINCNKEAPEVSVPGINSKSYIADLASRWLSGQGHNYVNECYNDVIGRAVAAGINPAFALWIWIHESGASNYDAFDHPIQDFGINDASVENNFTTQITRFLGLPRSYKAQYPHCYNNSYNEMQNFIRIYFIGATAPDTPCLPTEKTLDYYNIMKGSWDWVTTLPFPNDPNWP